MIPPARLPPPRPEDSVSEGEWSSSAQPRTTPWPPKPEPKSRLSPELINPLSLPMSTNVSIERFHDYLITVFSPSELCGRLSSRTPAKRADVHVLQLASAYANLWVLLDRSFQAIIRSRGVDFCNLTAAIHIVLSNLPPYDLVDSSSSDSDYEEYAVCTADVHYNEHPIPRFTDPRIGSTMGQVVDALETTKIQAFNSAAKRSSQMLQMMGRKSHTFVEITTQPSSPRTVGAPSRQPIVRRVPPALESHRPRSTAAPALPPRPTSNSQRLAHPTPPIPSPMTGNVPYSDGRSPSSQGTAMTSSKGAVDHTAHRSFPTASPARAQPLATGVKYAPRRLPPRKTPPKPPRPQPLPYLSLRSFKLKATSSHNTTSPGEH